MDDSRQKLPSHDELGMLKSEIYQRKQSKKAVAERN